MSIDNQTVLIFPYNTVYNMGKHSNSPVERLKKMKPSFFSAFIFPTDFYDDIPSGMKNVAKTNTSVGVTRDESIGQGTLHRTLTA